jgi:hypothetical protein
MKPRLATAALLALLASAGCVDNWASVEPFAVCAPPEDAEVCAQAGECELLLSASPWMSTLLGGLPNSLWLWIQFNNQLANNADPSAGRVNTNDFQALEMDLEYSGAGAATSVFGIPVSFTVPAGGSFAPLLQVIRETQASQFLATIPMGATGTVVVDVTVRGRFVGGNDLEIGPFQVVADVWNGDPGFAGCLDPADVLVACPKEGQTATYDCVTP